MGRLPENENIHPPAFPDQEPDNPQDPGNGYPTWNPDTFTTNLPQVHQILDGGADIEVDSPPNPLAQDTIRRDYDGTDEEND